MTNWQYRRWPDMIGARKVNVEYYKNIIRIIRILLEYSCLVTKSSFWYWNINKNKKFGFN